MSEFIILSVGVIGIAGVGYCVGWFRGFKDGQEAAYRVQELQQGEEREQKARKP